MSKYKKLLAIFMAGAVLITCGMLPQSNAATAAEEMDYGISNPRVENGITIWDKIKFGSYYQDDVKVQDAEPIKWRVLSVDGDDAFLLADQNLDSKPYNEERTDVTWETCTLRKWLNEDFYNEAFDEEEKNAIKETIVINDEHTGEGTESSGNTTDKVYLLSAKEICSAEYGFGTTFNEGSNTRKAKNTYFAEVNAEAVKAYCIGEWWLRSCGVSNDIAAFIDYYGCGIDDGRRLYDEEDEVRNNVSGVFAVRPVLHINLSSSKAVSAGKVDSDGNIMASDDIIDNPVVEDEVTTWDCVYFGSYRQSREFIKQDLEWRVLSVNGDDAFLLADKNLDCKPYDEDFGGFTWETCALRKWLNEDFYNEAFDEGEQNAIMTTIVVNDDNLLYGSEGGNNTVDKVYLLSAAEAGSSEYGFDTIFSIISQTRQAKNTHYAKVNGVSEYSSYDNTSGCGWWWLRSPGNHSWIFSASYVNSDGKGEEEGDAINSDWIGVRPVLHIDLSSSCWSKAGEVTAVRTSGTPTPTEPAATTEPTEKPDGTGTTEPNTTQNTPTPTASVTAQPEPQATTLPIEPPALKKLKLSSVKCVKNTKKITGKVSVSKASVKIKIGKKAYKKALVKGKKFTLKLNYKLKSKTKITVKVEKKGYKRLIKTYMVK